MKQKTIVLFLVLALLCTVLVGCGGREQWAGDGRVRVLSTVFPSYDFARAVGGEAVDARMLVRPGSNMHSYEPTANDAILIKECDIFISKNPVKDRSERIYYITEICDELCLIFCKFGNFYLSYSCNINKLCEMPSPKPPLCGTAYSLLRLSSNTTFGDEAAGRSLV